MVAGAFVESGTTAVAGEEFARLRRRDSGALDQLIERYQHRLYRYLLRLAPEAADDLFQQTWLRVVESVRRYDPRRGTDGWLFAIAHNLAIDHLRRRAPLSLDAEPGECRIAACEPDAFERLLAHQRSAALAAAMAQLPPLYRETLTLRFEEEMKLEEIAETTGAPLATVKSRLRRGLEALRGKLL